jgi:hypothetical protein
MFKQVTNEEKMSDFDKIAWQTSSSVFLVTEQNVHAIRMVYANSLEAGNLRSSLSLTNNYF